MASRPLTDTAIRALKPKERPYKESDGGGLYLLVQPAGSRLWRLAYRFGGKQKTLAIGAYPTIGLADARRRRDAAKELLATGRDPGAVKKEEKRAARRAAADTFEAVARQWFDSRKAGWVSTYSTRIMSRLEADIFPEIGAMPIKDIEPPVLLDAIRKIEARGAVELAKRVKNVCGEVFRYAIAEGKAQRDPSADIRGALKKPGPKKHRAALKASELPAFMAALAAYDGDERTRLALRLVLLTFVRTNEIRYARKDEFEDLDGEFPLWRISAERMKMRNPHLVPLSPQAVEVVKALIALAGRSDHLFPSYGSKGVMSENTMIYALYRMGYHSRATVHGFRATASTILNEQGFNGDWVERQLAHVEQDQVRAAYNAAEWLPERRRMMIWWADYLDRQAEAGELIG